MLVWIILNCFWLTLLRRYTISALLSLTLVVLLVALSRLKHEIVFMTINFFDVLVVDSDSFAFLLNMFPNLGKAIIAGCRWLCRSSCGRGGTIRCACGAGMRR